LRFAIANFVHGAFIDSLAPARSALRAFAFGEFLSPLPKLLKSPGVPRITSAKVSCVLFIFVIGNLYTWFFRAEV
jgi:hypothetical protein